MFEILIKYGLSGILIYVYSPYLETMDRNACYISIIGSFFIGIS